MRVKIIFAWYDIWIGAYLDRKNKTLYLLPVPMLGIVIKFSNAIPCDECRSNSNCIDNKRCYVKQQKSIGGEMPWWYKKYKK
jgi:hypothetical protein